MMNLLPRKDGLTLLLCAVGKIEVDQCLIRDSRLFGQRFEVLDGVAVEVDGDLAFQFFDIGIFCRLRKIVFFQHYLSPPP